MKKLQRKRKGFTLIELVVVIVIIAILAAVALLSFGNFTKTARDSRIKQEHSQLITAGNMARAASDTPGKAPTWAEIMDYMEGSKLLEGQTTLNGTSTVHVYDSGKLTSHLSDEGNDLEYTFVTVGEEGETPEPTEST